MSNEQNSNDQLNQSMPDGASAETDSPTSKNPVVSPRLIFTDPIMFLAFGLGSGLSRIGPGTAGTIVAIPFAVMLSRLTFWQELLVIIALFVVGIFICDYATRKLGVHDHSGIVWDEIVGYFLTVLFVPNEWLWWLLGFVLFRIFDIFKPWPIREMDHRIHGGIGIMLDDIVAALFAVICLAFLSWGWSLM